MDFIKIFNEIREKILPVLTEYRQHIETLKVDIKDDKTFLTKADCEVQDIIVNIIRKYDKCPNIIAEEKNDYVFDRGKESAWIIDPIDGTSQFIDPERIEFCSCVCFFKKGLPIASFVLMPELGRNRKTVSAIALVEKNEIYIDNDLIKYSRVNVKNKFASTTRSKGTNPSVLENELFELNYTIKNRTTSQTIDMIRTAIDLSKCSIVDLPKFDIFYREKQKIWDGAPGICFNEIVGNSITTSTGKPILPLNLELLSQNPITNSILIKSY